MRCAVDVYAYICVYTRIGIYTYMCIRNKVCTAYSKLQKLEHVRRMISAGCPSVLWFQLGSRLCWDFLGSSVQDTRRLNIFIRQGHP